MTTQTQTDLETRAIDLGKRLGSCEHLCEALAAAGLRSTGQCPEQADQAALIERLAEEPFSLSRSHSDL